MARANYYEDVVRIISKLFVCDPLTLTPDTDLAKDLGAKSIIIMQTMNAIEDEFDITLNFMEFRRKATVGNIAAYVEEECEG